MPLAGFFYAINSYQSPKESEAITLPFSGYVSLDINQLTTITTKMGFKKGISGNPKGRPRGKYTKSIKSKLEGLLCKAFPAIESEIENAAPEIRREFFTDIAGIVLQDHKQTI